MPDQVPEAVAPPLADLDEVHRLLAIGGFVLKHPVPHLGLANGSFPIYITNDGGEHPPDRRVRHSSIVSLADASGVGDGRGPLDPAAADGVRWARRSAEVAGQLVRRGRGPARWVRAGGDRGTGRVAGPRCAPDRGSGWQNSVSFCGQAGCENVIRVSVSGADSSSRSSIRRALWEVPACARTSTYRRAVGARS